MNKLLNICVILTPLLLGCEPPFDPETLDVQLSSEASDPAERNLKTLLDEPGMVLAKFGAPWCPPCRAIDEELDKVTGPVSILKISVDDSPDLAKTFRVAGIPHLVLFQDGKPIDMKRGFLTADAISDWVRRKNRELH